MAKKKGTTRKTEADVSRTEDPGEPEPVETRPMVDSDNPKRGSIIEEIARKRREDIEEELNEDRPADDPGRVQLRAEEGETDGAQPKPDPEPEPEPEPEPGQLEPEPVLEPEPEPAELMVKVTIDGEVREVPASAITVPTKVNGTDKEVGGQELINGFQIASHGHKRLREANRRLQEAQRLENQNKAQQPEPDSLTVEPDPATPISDEEGISKEDSLVMARKFQFGDEEELAEVIRQIHRPAQGRGNPATPQASVQEVVDHSITKAAAQERFQKDVDTIEDEHPELKTDPILGTVAANFVHQIRSRDLVDAGYDLSGTTQMQREDAYRAEQLQGMPGFRSNIELFRLAAEATQAWTKTFSGAPGEPGEQGFEKKREAKRNAGQAPKAARAFSAKPQERLAPTRSQAVDIMRKARGQPVA